MPLTQRCAGPPVHLQCTADPLAVIGVESTGSLGIDLAKLLM